jgi:hypothetical protein
MAQQESIQIKHRLDVESLRARLDAVAVL